ncbi:hypothetical protein B0A52_08447 [Exophiala mesophila]|uniref:Uncharacterized protein n=1 Tax=Exophiala mesophila TaxID=212818 RepID=A0A438MWB3_EXOME|nr:hypothetical protein B0A52_08447 [Exophiala mesophila]
MDSNPGTSSDAAGERMNLDRGKQVSPQVMKEYAEEQRKRRATIILDNYQLLMRYALENQKSIPQTRIYFQRVAVGEHPAPIIRNWFPVSR